MIYAHSRTPRSAFWMRPEWRTARALHWYRGRPPPRRPRCCLDSVRRRAAPGHGGGRRGGLDAAGPDPAGAGLGLGHGGARARAPTGAWRRRDRRPGTAREPGAQNSYSRPRRARRWHRLAEGTSTGPWARPDRLLALRRLRSVHLTHRGLKGVRPGRWLPAASSAAS